jgi:hypothetical protein
VLLKYSGLNKPVTKHALSKTRKKKVITKKACVGYTRADAQVRQPSVGYVVEKFNTALGRVRRLVGIVPDVQVCIHENKNKIAKE